MFPLQEVLSHYLYTSIRSCMSSTAETLTQSLRQLHAHRILEDIASRSQLRKRLEARNMGMKLGGQDFAEAK